MDSLATPRGRHTATPAPHPLSVWFRAWVARNVIAPDPAPAYTRLDRADNLTQAAR